MTKDELLIFINDIIDEENGLPVTEESYLLDSDMDSFSFAVLWFKMDDEFDCIDNEYIKNIDYVTYSIRDLVEKVSDEC